MTIKNLGHYEGIVEDIDFKSLKFKTLNPIHKELIILFKEKNELKNGLEAIDNKIEEIKKLIEPEIKNLDWAWIWMLKRTSVPWKQEFIKTNGIKAAENVANQYKNKEYPQIGIKYIDPIPDSITQIKTNPSKFPIKKLSLRK